MKHWLLNHIAVKGLFDAGLLTIISDFRDESREVSPDVGLTIAPQYLTVQIGPEMFDVVHTDLAEQTWELRPVGCL